MTPRRLTPFDVLVACWMGQPLPPLPTIAGRVHRQPFPTDGDPLADEYDRQHSPPPRPTTPQQPQPNKDTAS